MANRTDETWHRLQVWTDSSTAAERLAAQILIAADYKDIDPIHPLGGKDGRKDARCTKHGEPCIMAVYFPRGQQSFTEIKKKFIEDHAGVAANGARSMAFVTNQEIRDAERTELMEAVDTPVDIFHVERLTAILDQPSMHPVREQFLKISASGASAPTSAPVPSRTARELLDAAIDPPGAGRRGSVYDGMLALRVVVAPAPYLRHPQADNPRAALTAASMIAVEMAKEWPVKVSLLARRLGDEWRSAGPHRWGAGFSSEDAAALAQHNFAAASFITQQSVVCVDRTWATGVRDPGGQVSYCTAREVHVAAELLVALRLGSALLEPLPRLEAVDVVVQIAAAPKRLVANERAAGLRFHEPEWHEAWDVDPPPAEVPSHHLDNGRFSVDELRDSFVVARSLLGPWLATFRADDVFASIAADA
ncbi:MAG: hypothetical protein ACRDM7_12835 [Thermoleophilaceae bacterium]